MTMQLDHDELHRLLAALADSDIQEFRLEGEDFRLEVRRNLPASLASIPDSSSNSFASDQSAPSPQLRVESSIDIQPKNKTYPNSMRLKNIKTDINQHKEYV